MGTLIGRVFEKMGYACENEWSESGRNELFAFLHDICRRSNGTDPGHGKRAAEFIDSLEPKLINICLKRIWIP